jgi:N-acetylglucosaminyldiphosphoundecaprenol N-acetyl-beta-D-mannosaminyltransferase
MRGSDPINLIAHTAPEDWLKYVISFGQAEDAKTNKSVQAAAVTIPTRSALLDDLTKHLVSRKGFALATLNLDHVVKLTRLPEFRAAYLAQTHVVADGNPIIWLHRLAGRPVELIPGSEMIAPLSALAARLQVPVALLGSTADTLAVAAARLEQDNPGLQVVARIAPPQGFDPSGAMGAAALDEVRISGARLCFLALGAPRQEVLAARGLRLLPQVGFVSIGAGLDFIAGHQSRAPVWVRRIAMEWAWRVALDPRRLARRYLDCGLALPGLAVQAWQARG